MKKFSILLVAVMLVSLFPSDEAFSQHKLESWYFYFALGYADPQYGDDTDAVVEQIENTPGINHASVGVDLPGFYWRKGEHTIIGGVINAFGDRFEDNNTNVTVQLTGYTVAFSTMYFLTDIVGKGFFLRADAGPARFVLDIDGGGVLSGQAASEWGFGGLVGAGFGLPVGAGTRILLNVNYGFRKVEGESSGALGITVGGLF